MSKDWKHIIDHKNQHNPNLNVGFLNARKDPSFLLITLKWTVQKDKPVEWKENGKKIDNPNHSTSL
jgi:hypothetical protein